MRKMVFRLTVSMLLLSILGTAQEKTIHRTQFRARTNQEWDPLLSMCVDGDTSVPAAPSAVTDPGDGGVWDDATWDESIWAASPISDVQRAAAVIR